MPLTAENLRAYSGLKNAMPAYQLGNLPFYLTGEILLQPKPDVPVGEILNIINNRAKIKSGTKYNTFVLETDDWKKLLEYANRIYESGLVQYCHPNFIAPVERTADPLYPEQYYLNNTGQFGGTAGIDINAPEAWGITTGSSDIRVAVIDDGVETHEELTGRVLQGFTPQFSNANPDTQGAPNANDPRPTDYPYDSDGPFGHGESCTGIIAASHNNVGVRGVAPNVRILPINIFNDWEIIVCPFEGCDSMLVYNEDANDYAAAIDWAWDDGNADVLSNSWGYTADPDNIDQVEVDAISAAIGRARTQGRNGLGSIVVFSSGNSNEDFTGVTFPANVEGVITVGAVDRNGNISDYSSRGPEMDLVAPSSGSSNDVRTIDRMGNAGYNSGNYMTDFGGTSAACPQVSGVAALMLSSNPFLLETDVRSTLQQTATDMGPSGFDNTYGFGRVNAYAAVEDVYLHVTGPDFVCASNVTFSLQNAPPGATITWTADRVSPSSGTGPSASFHSSCSNIGNGKVTFTISRSGLTRQASKSYIAGGPDPNDVSLDVFLSTGQKANKNGGIWVLCPNKTYHIYLINTSSCTTSNYTWILPSSLSLNYQYNNMVSVTTNSNPGGNIIVKSATCCTDCGSNVQILSDYVGRDYSCGYGYMSFTPNPTTGETAMELETDKLKEYDENAEWEMAIYDDQMIKMQGPIKAKGSKYIIDTSGWKNGLYIVKVKLKDKVLFGKFVVER